MTTRRRRGSVSFHDDPPSDAKKGQYKDVIARAKKKSRDVLPPLEGTPRFDEIPKSSQEPDRKVPTELSQDTVKGLEAIQARTLQEDLQDETVASQEFLDSLPAEGEEEKTPEEEMRDAIEARLGPIDIGRYLSTGECQQEVPIIPGQLVVTFRTVLDEEETYVDEVIAGKDKLSQRQFIRLTGEWSLATHIAILNGTRWPSIYGQDGAMNETALTQRIGKARKISSPIFNLVTLNLGWFLERVNRALTVGVLKNG